MIKNNIFSRKGRIMKKISKAVKAIAFLLVCSICLTAVSKALQFEHEMQPELAMREFYDLEENTIQMYILGSSHTTMGFSPMECYKNNKITSFNLSTASQPIEVSYYLLEEGLKKQNPEVVVLEVANLFYKKEDISIGKFRYTMDSMPLSMTKVKMAICYANYNSDFKLFSIGEALCPIYYYHDRWKDMNEEEFNINQAVPQLKGQVIRTNIREINYDLEKFDKKLAEKIKNDPNEEPKISKKNMSYLLKIKELCDKNNIKLLLTSTPTNRWNSVKENLVEEACKEYGLDFLNMNLEDGKLINYSTDMADGNHVNASGAKKTTKFLSEYVIKNYGVKGKACKSYDESIKYYDAYYDNMIKYCMETDFNDYLSMLNENKDKLTIFVTSKSEMTQGLQDKDVKQLKNLGCTIDFDKSNYENSYIAVIDGGKLTYEQVGQKGLTDKYTLGNGAIANLYSNGDMVEGNTIVNIDNYDYAINGNGLNIVVYDKESGLVIDSVAFNTHDSQKAWYRSEGRSLELLIMKSYRDWTAEKYQEEK